MQPPYFSASKFLFNVKAKHDEPLEWGFLEAKWLFPNPSYINYLQGAQFIALFLSGLQR